jgi:hypothetical protein
VTKAKKAFPGALDDFDRQMRELREREDRGEFGPPVDWSQEETPEKKRGDET